MDKRYQVFVSSTFTDLKDERRDVMQAILEMDHFPAGMELFPSGNSTVSEYIKKILNQTDYYIVIIGNRYGTTKEDGLSYTEAEYDYADSLGIPIIGLVHGRPESLAVDRSDAEPELRQRLHAFRSKVRSRIVREWVLPHELVRAAMAALHLAIRDEPARGWVRAAAPSRETVIDGLDDVVRIAGTYDEVPGSPIEWSIDISWRELFGAFAASIDGVMLEGLLEQVLITILSRLALPPAEYKKAANIVFYRGTWTVIRNQLRHLKLISTRNGPNGPEWALTDHGTDLFLAMEAAQRRLAP